MDYKKLAQLVERAKEGSAEAFAGIYSQFSQSIYYMGLRMTKSEFDAKDIVQETMIKLHQNLHTIKDPKAVQSFVSSTAYRCCIDLLRKKKPVQMDDETDSVLQGIPDDDSEFIPEAFLAQKEQREYIIQLIEELNESQRSVVLLYYYQQLSVTQISHDLGVEESAVRNRLFRARATLKRKLETSKWKEVLAFVMVLPVLTQILQIDADAAFSQELSSELWGELGTQLGYSASTIAATTTAATAASDVAVPTTIAGAASTGSTAFTAAIAALSATVLLAGGAWLYSSRTPQSDSLDITPDKPFSTASMASQYDEAGPNISASIDPDTSHTSRDQTETSSLSPGEAASPLDDAAGIIQPNGPDSAFETATITAATRYLTYPAGSSVTPDKLLADAGIVATDAAGQPLTMEITYFDTINFKKPNHYAVYAQAVDAGGTPLSRIAIVILIT